MRQSTNIADRAALGAHEVNVLNSLQFASVKDSRENLFSAAVNNGLTTPVPPKFRFEERRERINWKPFLDADLSKIRAQVDLKTLESLLQNITYAKVERDDVERFPKDFVKVFQLSQMSIEYLIYTQNYLECLTQALDMQYKTAYEQCKTYKEDIHGYQSEIKKLNKEKEVLTKTVDSLRNLKEMPIKEGDVSRAVLCKHCGRMFASEHFLRKHYERRHPERAFDKEYPTKADVQQLQDNSQKEIEARQRKETQEFVDGMKKELKTSLKGSLDQLAGEIKAIKGEQGKLQGLERNQADQSRRLEAALLESAKLLRTSKEAWYRQLESHNAQVNEVVRRTVSESLRAHKKEQDQSLQRQQSEQKRLDQEVQRKIQADLKEYKAKVEELRKALEGKDTQLQSSKKQTARQELEVRQYRDEITSMKLDMNYKEEELSKVTKTLSQGVDKAIQKENMELVKQVTEFKAQLEQMERLEQDNGELKLKIADINEQTRENNRQAQGMADEQTEKLRIKMKQQKDDLQNEFDEQIAYEKKQSQKLQDEIDELRKQLQDEKKAALQPGHLRSQQTFQPASTGLNLQDGMMAALQEGHRQDELLKQQKDKQLQNMLGVDNDTFKSLLAKDSNTQQQPRAADDKQREAEKKKILDDKLQKDQMKQRQEELRKKELQELEEQQKIKEDQMQKDLIKKQNEELRKKELQKLQEEELKEKKRQEEELQKERMRQEQQKLKEEMARQHKEEQQRQMQLEEQERQRKEQERQRKEEEERQRKEKQDQMKREREEAFKEQERQERLAEEAKLKQEMEQRKKEADLLQQKIKEQRDAAVREQQARQSKQEPQVNVQQVSKPEEQQIEEEIEEDEYEYEYYDEEDDPSKSKSGAKFSLSGSTKTKQYLQFQMAEREKEKSSFGKGELSQRSLFQHSKRDKMDALKDARAELKIGAEQLLQEQISRHGLDPSGNLKSSDEFGFQGVDQSVDKQIQKMKRLDLSKLNTKVKEELQVKQDKDYLDYNQYIEDVLEDSSQSLPNFYDPKRK